MDIDTSDRKQQRNFGLVMAVAITVLGLIRWALHRGEPPYPFFAVAAVFLVLGLLVPAILRPVLIVWMKFAEALNWFMTRLLLTIAFFGIILPTAMIMRLAGKDPLNRKWDPSATSYWEDPEDQPTEMEHYFNQF
ncbi:MAG TPA: SxtJ family membrane protein [Candidatus Hydrogenedentes bacterium]|nr:SxtJ family membrane protein [Candidatus Hydrogenedentota bacterium]HPG66874.1 SxtJ family membrane protein [Candidatus Hydrogenedentota bacterium]